MLKNISAMKAVIIILQKKARRNTINGSSHCFWSGIWQNRRGGTSGINTLGNTLSKQFKDSLPTPKVDILEGG